MYGEQATRTNSVWQNYTINNDDKTETAIYW